MATLGPKMFVYILLYENVFGRPNVYFFRHQRGFFLGGARLLYLYTVYTIQYYSEARTTEGRVEDVSES